MLERLKAQITSPIFKDDEDRTRIAGFLNSMLLAMLVIGLIFVPIGAFTKGSYPGVVIFMGMLTALAPVMLLLLRRGYVISMGVLLVSLSFIAAIGCVSVVGSIRVPIASLFLLCVAVAGLLFGHRGTVVVTVLSQVALLGLWWAETTGLLPPYRPAGLAPFVTHSALLFGTAVLLVVITRNLNDTLERTRHAEQTLTESNRRLEDDITKRKGAEEALKASEGMYRTLVSVSPDAISVVDVNGLLTFVSSKARQMFGHSPDEEIFGRHLLSWVVPEEQEKAAANIRHLLAEGTLIANEYILILSLIHI